MDAPSSPKFRLSLLGRFELSGPDGPADLPNKKLAGLLAYLACTAPTPQHREKLATLLWGSHFEAQARQNLRQALFRLRRVLGQDGLIGDGEQIALAPGLIDCDVTRLEALIREGSQASLAAAADLYKDRLLADVTVREETWADWVAGEQQRLESLALDAMIRHAEQELQSGSPKQALAAASKAIGFSSLREDAHRLVIRALAAAGRRADALKHYEHLIGLLKGELGVEPDIATRALAADLRESQRAAALDAAQPPSTIQVLPPLPDRPSIAVLPFQNLSGGPDQDYFADGMVEEIITALSRIRWLFVIARNSSFTYRDRAVDVKQVGRELGVLYVLEGSVRKAGNRIRITAQLLDATSGAHLWADRFDGAPEDIFGLQDNVASSVAGVIEPTLQAAEFRRAAQRPTNDLSAYDLYLRACADAESWDMKRVLHALDLLKQALDRDAHYGSALSLAALCHVNVYVNGWASDLEATCHEG
jgi:TolB-like protein